MRKQHPKTDPTMKTPVHATSLRRAAGLIIPSLLLLLCICCTGEEPANEELFTNPVILKFENTALYFHEGTYYNVTNPNGNLALYACEDPTQMEQTRPSIVCPIKERYGLMHIWHPQIVNLRGKWYIYLSADDGNTDDHRIYVFENPEKDPRDGEFVMRGRIQTDPEDNWALHPHAFEYDDELYLVWSGWESRRVYAETQAIYIARLENPWTRSSPRVRISVPEYEWERQWVNPNGYKTAYPVYVNEAPFFFGNDRTDRLYIYYSASAMWTPYYAIGELSASKGSDLLNAASWKKRPKPVFSMNDPAWKNGQENQDADANGVYAPGYPYIIPSPDGSEYYLVYMARDIAGDPYRPYSRTVRMQKIGFSPAGAPELGVPEPVGKPLNKPSGVKPTSQKPNITNHETK